MQSIVVENENLYKEIVQRIYNRTGIQFNWNVVREWYEGADECTKEELDSFEFIALTLIGSSAYKRAQIVARVTHALQYVLGLEERVVGGIDMENLLNINE